MVARRRIVRKPRRANRKVRRARKSKKASLAPTRQYATIVETLASNDVFADTAYQAQFQLSDFYRATTVAKNFKFYRAKKVKWEYMPLYNTFQEGLLGANSVGKPQFYMLMNREQDTEFSTLAPIDALFAIQCGGADPTPFIKNKELIYRPNWNSPGLSAYQFTPNPPGLGTVNGLVSLGSKRQYGWLPTPNDDVYRSPDRPNFIADPTQSVYTTAPQLNGGVVYMGHNFYIQQANEPNNKVGKVICTVEWEFKGGKQLYAPPIRLDVEGNELPPTKIDEAP